MREQIRSGKQATGPLGIRSDIWLIALGVTVLCVIMASLVPRNAEQTTFDAGSENVSHRNSSTYETRSRKTGQIEITPASTETEATHVVIDDALLAVISEITGDRRTWMDAPE